MLGARLDLYAVLFISRRCDSTLAWPPAVQLRLDVSFCEGEKRRDAVYDHTDRFAVRFAVLLMELAIVATEVLQNIRVHAEVLAKG